MNTKKYHWVLYIIVFTIITTIAVQVYWNYKNYQQNKRYVLNEIQTSLDNAVEEYFTDLAKNNFVTIVNEQTELVDSTHNHFMKNKIINGKIKVDSIFKHIEINLQNKLLNNKDSIAFKQLLKENSQNTLNGIQNYTDITVIKNRNSLGNLKLMDNLKTILVSIEKDTISYKKLDSLIKNQLTNKQLDISYYLAHIKGDSLFYPLENIPSVKLRFNKNNRIQFHWKENDSLASFSKSGKIAFEMFGINSKSTFLRNNEQLKLIYHDTSFEALKRSSFGIFLSLLLSLAIVFSLYYLLHIINKQKELAAIKNDLISNITHEFKTPITTVSTAIEAINTFNAIDDKEKTKKYLSMSSIQLKKLHQMVEKLLETATLDSENLFLKKENVNIVELIKNTLRKSEFNLTEKNISFHTTKETINIEIDSFHFENAISNLLDNAIKYGGDQVEVTVTNVLNILEISIADNGVGIEKSQREKIFDQFYRIPKGNTHDVKGFGIGLYYTKKIIEKHGGEIRLASNTNNTVFKIFIPI